MVHDVWVLCQSPSRWSPPRTGRIVVLSSDATRESSPTITRRMPSTLQVMSKWRNDYGTPSINQSIMRPFPSIVSHSGNPNRVSSTK
jgi:hypothetical protein